MKKYSLLLKSEISESYRCQRAANSLDIDTSKKSVHEFNVEADIDSPFNIGLIIGASGSGKTTLANHIYGKDCFKTYLDLSRPVIDQFPKEMSYDECASVLSGVGLTSVVCWIRPAYTLSNGQRARAEAALACYLSDSDTIIIDEWTSVVDRTVAKVMSHSIQKFARKNNKKIVLLSCHYDVAEWLSPEWIIDCNKQEFYNMRGLPRMEREHLQFDIREVDRSTWKYFSKYHYLSEKIPPTFFVYGLFSGPNQIGFLAYSNYMPWKDKKKKMMLHFNRLVIHPDYAGLGLGIHFVNECSKIVSVKYDVRGSFSSIPTYKSLIRSKSWVLIDNKLVLKHNKGKTIQSSSMRTKVRMFSFKFVGQ